MKPADIDWEAPAALIAPAFLGMRLRVRSQEGDTEVALSEVEAYGPDDPASHSFKGITRRNATMFGAPGLLYVYLSYGVHWCANIVVGPEGTGAAVLLRAGVPTGGEALMKRRRGTDRNVTLGPGNLTKALGINGEDDGTKLLSQGSRISLLEGETVGEYRAGPRIGVTLGAESQWRFRTMPSPRVRAPRH
ncbi:MAG TPA: DNA-3-methyladenine glycosylase [Acidimicrobiia bacterium]|jgi:DNA-3-methyladenine glycosylase